MLTGVKAEADDEALADGVWDLGGARRTCGDGLGERGARREAQGGRAPTGGAGGWALGWGMITAAAPAATDEVHALAVRREDGGSAAAQDAALVERFKGGDETAFAELVERHRSKVVAVALSILRDAADAEEIAADTFVRAYRELGLANFSEESAAYSSLAAWLHHEAAKLARDRYWYFRRRRRALGTRSLDGSRGVEGARSEASASTSGEGKHGGEAQTERSARREDFTELVTVCRGKLAAQDREMLALRDVLNRSCEEIATTLDVEVGAVEGRIARARGHLRSLMGDTGPDLGAEASAGDGA